MNNFQKLIADIAKIDKDAALYAATHFEFEDNYDDTEDADLMIAFVWHSTPQGHNYWMNIHAQLP